MSIKETKTTNKVEMDEEHEKRLRIDKLKEKFRNSNIEYKGRLYIDEKHKKPGKVLRIDNDDPATRNYLEGLGYSVVQDSSIKVGSGSLAEPSSMGSAVHIEQGIMISQPGVLYEIDDEYFTARKELEAEENDRQLQDKIEENQAHLR